MCLASEDDQTPIIELWDVRVPTSPLKTLQGHQRGVLSIAWNPQDADLLLSCAKDNRILCWNPNSSALVLMLLIYSNKLVNFYEYYLLYYYIIIIHINIL